MGLVRFISRLLVGLVFTFSGFVKCVDPLGTVYKFQDYFVHFELDGLMWIITPAAILMCALELSIGIMLIFNIKTPWAAWLALIFMAVFTPLTLYLAIKNPVTDCGCFGDALIITNWQTFYKNIVLDVFVIILFLGRNKYKTILRKKSGAIAAVTVLLLAVGFEIYSMSRIPIIDFRPYKTGVNIIDDMTIPEGAKEAVYETTLVYKKDGVEKEFTINNYPQGDGWEWVSTENKLIEKGYEPPIHDFSIILEDGDFTDVILADKNYTFLLISYDLEKASRKNQEEINSLASKLMSMGIQFICLTSSGPDLVEEFKNETGAPYTFGFTDQITLKTIIRSNPGLMLIKDGTIIDKWHHRSLPDQDDLVEKLNSSSY